MKNYVVVTPTTDLVRLDDWNYYKHGKKIALGLRSAAQQYIRI